ncbi:PREDICTED: uncharacterized protein LOC106124319 [Papilio xuthus]|uniref:Uncharacterized protein LOC106124319 n=1 Tax=Papilio xuthus TaxID=66420 RepID=A0AAJ7EGA7_PAPXU|nr:PREDICTED: uncharacterized protein LOC106124319 [Papilio xuthus]
MFIYLIYRDEPELSYSLVRKRSSESELDSSVEETLLLNPDCHVRVMLEYIRKKCKLGIYTHFDICDEDGVLKKLFSLPPYTNGAEYFEHRKTYYVIVLQEIDRRVTALPQLNHENRLYAELKTRIRNYMLSEDGSRHTSPMSKQSPSLPSKTSLKPGTKKK